MKEKMTVHKALSELKVLNERLEKEISNSTFVTVNKHSNAKINGIPVSDLKGQMVDKYKSIRSLINRRNAIKYAITKSNASTMVEVDGKKYTVAEAIDMKSLGMNHLRSLLSRFETQYSRAQALAERDNGDSLEQRCNKHIESVYQGADVKSMADEIEKARKTFIEAQTVELVDPLNAAKVIEELKNTIDSFTSEVDAALSVSNALTTIEVEYETV